MPSPDFGRSRVLLSSGVLATILALILVALLSDSGRTIFSAAVSGNGRALRQALLSLGLVGVLVLLAVVLSHALIPFPTELVTGAAGYVYGFWLALPLLLGFWLGSAIISYKLAERYGRPLARRVAGHERIARGERFVARGGAGALLSMRLIPLVPFNAVCYAAGLTGVPIVRYAWTTLVGMAPLTILVTYLGSRLEKPHFDDPRLWVAVVGIVGLVALGQLLARRFGRAGRSR